MKSGTGQWLLRLGRLGGGFARLLPSWATIFALPSIFFLFRIYLDSRAKMGRTPHQAAMIENIKLALVLAGVFAMFGFLWHRVRAAKTLDPRLRILQSPAACVVGVVALTGGILVGTHGQTVLDEYLFFVGVSVVVALYFAVHLAFGLFLLRRTPLALLRFTKLETLVIAWLTAEGLSGIVLFSLSVLGAHPGLVASLTLLAMVVMARAELGRIGMSLLRPARPPVGAMGWEGIWWGAFGTVAIAVFFLNWSRVASPAWMSDEVMVHLASVKAYTVAGEMSFIPQLRSSFLHPLMQCLFLPLWYISQDLGPRLLEGAFWTVSGLLTYALGRRAGLPRQLARLAALLVVATPLFTFLAGICFLGLPSTGFALATYLVALQSLKRAPLGRGQCHALAVLLGTFLAFLYWVKLQAWGTVAPVALVLLVGFGRRRLSPRAAARFLVLACLVAALLIAPHLVRNQIEIGNPVFPLLRDQLGAADNIFSDADVATLEGIWSRLGMGRSASDFLKLPARLVLNEAEFGAIARWGLGFAWLVALPLALVGLSRRNWWVTVFVLAISLPWFFLGQELRYLIYVFPLVAILVARGVERLWGEKGTVIAIGALLIIVSAPMQAPALGIAPGTLGIRGEDRERFVEERVPGYAAIKWINEHTASDARIYTIALSSNLLLDDPARMLGDWFGEYRFSKVVEVGGEGIRFQPVEMVVSNFREWEVDYVLINTKTKLADFASLLLEDNAELKKYLSPPVNYNGVLVYQFDPEGGFGDGGTIESRITQRPIAWEWLPGLGEPIVDSEAQRITLHPSDSVQLFLNPSRVQKQAIYEVEAFAVGEGSQLRLQAVWLPENGWEALGPDGRPLRGLEISSTAIGVKATTARMLIHRREGAKDLQLMLVNDGLAEIVVRKVELREID